MSAMSRDIPSINGDLDGELMLIGVDGKGMSDCDLAYRGDVLVGQRLSHWRSSSTQYLYHEI